MSARSKARKRALDVLYESDMRGTSAIAVLESQIERRAETGDPSLNDYVSALVNGVVANAERIDELLSTYAMGWTLARMPAVDRSILRLGCYEVLWCDDIPDPVAISEWVALAQDLSTQESATFVNGLLARLSDVKVRLGIEPQGAAHPGVDSSAGASPVADSQVTNVEIPVTQTPTPGR